ncbi:MAG: archease [Candidatus Bathyarchaeia archaeon]
MNSKKGFKFLEHTADVYIAAYGKNIEEAFENAALAMFNVMTDTKKVNPSTLDHVEVNAPDKLALLYNWLETLLVKFETKNTLYSKFKIATIKETSNGLSLKAKIWGEKIDLKKHAQKVGVKAVTYHRMEIIEEPGKVTAKFILDI